MRIVEPHPTRCRTGFAITVLLVALSLVFPVFGRPGEHRLEHPVVFCRLPAEAAPPAPRAGGMLPADYGAGGRLMLLEPDGKVVDLAPEFASACEPDVSFDGERILFAGQRQAGEPWNVFEIGVDGTGLRQITRETRDARHPIYLATLYTITSSEPWYTLLFVGDDGVPNETASAPGTSLYSVRLDGSERRRITFHPGNDRTPYLMQDGLLVFAGWRLPSGAVRESGRIGLFSLQTDGIDYASYAGRRGLRIQHMPTLTAGGTLVFVEADALGWDGAGRLAAVDTTRPHHTYRPLTEPADGLFHSPSPLDGETLLASHRTADGALRIVRFSLSAGLIGTVLEEPGYHLLHARRVAPRPEPDGRSSTVQPESPTGKLFALDVYESDTGVAELPPGTVRTVRVIEALPAEEADDDGRSSRIASRLLGEAPVEADGSFHIDVPADLPIRLELLDETGEALAGCDWIWVRPREFRGCIGCHEDPELTPPNRFVEAARRPATLLSAPVRPDGEVSTNTEER